MLQFDSRGHLSPYHVIDVTLGEFEEFFVASMPNNDQRHLLFQNYLRFLKEIRNLFKAPFYQWIDGSFTTNEVHPNDIDLITFLNYDVYQKHPYDLPWLKALGKIDLKIDCNFAFVCKVGHPEFESSKEIQQFWYNLYNSTRMDKNANFYPKGIVKISYGL